MAKKSEERIYNATMRDPLPPSVLTRLQIKREAESRVVRGTTMDLWTGVLRPALQSSDSVWEEWGMTVEVSFSDPLVDQMAPLMWAAESPGTTYAVYKDAFWRAAAIRTRA